MADTNETTQIDRCQRLRELRIRLNEEIRNLKESLYKVETDGIDSPVETRNIVKSLQAVLNEIDVELKKCK